MTTRIFQVLSQADSDRIHCSAPDCDKQATIVCQWQSAAMGAPAFWYFCSKHTTMLETQDKVYKGGKRSRLKTVYQRLSLPECEGAEVEFFTRRVGDTVQLWRIDHGFMAGVVEAKYFVGPTLDECVYQMRYFADDYVCKRRGVNWEVKRDLHLNFTTAYIPRAYETY